jgi:hypothetical protein
MSTQVDLNGITMLPRPTEGDSYPLGFYFTALTDWYSLSDSKSAIRERAQADGAFDIDRDWRTSAVVSFEGVYIGHDDNDTTVAKRQLRAAWGTGLEGLMTVTDPQGPTSRAVSIRDVKVTDDHGRRYFTFSVDMVALDPNRYGPVISASTGLAVAGTGYIWEAVWPADWGSGGAQGRADVTNPGDATTWPLLSVSGGLSLGVELVEVYTGSDLRLDRPIPVGSTVYFDARTGRVYIDSLDNDITGFLTRREWWSVPPGATRSVQINALGVATGSPLLTVQIAPAY